MRSGGFHGRSGISGVHILCGPGLLAEGWEVLALDKTLITGSETNIRAPWAENSKFRYIERKEKM